MTDFAIRVHDETGKVIDATDQTIARFKRIETLIEAKQYSIAPLGEDEHEWPAPSLILVHQTDMPNDMADKLERAAMAGTTVVIYSGGGIGQWEKHVGLGMWASLRWSEVEDILFGLPPRFSLEDFANAVRRRHKRHLVTTLAIVSWCVGHSSRQLATALHPEWSSPEKWRALFSGISSGGLRDACGLPAGGTTPTELGEVDKAIAWFALDGAATAVSGGTPPNFSCVATQLSRRFDLDI